MIKFLAIHEKWEIYWLTRNFRNHIKIGRITLFFKFRYHKIILALHIFDTYFCADDMQKICKSSYNVGKLINPLTKQLKIKRQLKFCQRQTIYYITYIPNSYFKDHSFFDFPVMLQGNRITMPKIFKEGFSLTPTPHHPTILLDCHKPT